MKTYLTILLSFLITPVLAFAALDVTVGDSTTISVNGISLVVSGDATLDSITVNDTNFSVVLSAGASIKVTSADRKALTASPNTYTTSSTCTSQQSEITLSMSSGSATTVTVTPSTSTCALPGGGSPGSVGGGGGGGSAVPTPVYTVIPGTASASSVSSASQQTSSASSVAAQTSGTQAAQTTSSAVSGATSGLTLTKQLKYGMKDGEVKALQQALAVDKTIYPEGLATGYYGPATRNAVIRFQKKYGIDPVGFVGPATRKKIMEVYGSSTVSAHASSGSTALSESSKQQQVQALQQLINQLLEQVKALQAKLGQ
ncbi:peptidoglycan-binding protein [Candidatus Parcubacteria bacterium]|nr:MAG: peptidoglycan-binding protein [Candidatus Parcubacteria bacterium]